jgi:hypothetical protein
LYALGDEVDKLVSECGWEITVGDICCGERMCVPSGDCVVCV